MKKLFYLMAFISLGMLSACNDDDDAQPLIPAEKINGTYDGSSETSALALTYGGEPLVGGNVSFNTTDSKTASLTLKNVIPGASEVTIDNVQLIGTTDAYTFSGSSAFTRAASGTIEYSGSIKEAQLELNINVTMAASTYSGKYALGGPRMGTEEKWDWNWDEYDAFEAGSRNDPPTIERITASNPFTCLYLRVDVEQPAYNATKWPEGWDYVDYIDGNNIVYNYSLMLRNAGVLLYQVLQSVTLETDGNITANYSSDALQIDTKWFTSGITQKEIEQLTAAKTWKTSPKNLTFWFEKDGMIYVKPNIAAIITQVLADSGQGDASIIIEMVNQILNNEDAANTINSLLKGFLKFELEPATINLVLSWVKDGVPLNIKSEDGHTYLYLDKETIAILAKEFPKLNTLLIESNPMEMGSMLASILQNFTNLFKSGVIQEFNVGLDLVKQ